MSRSGEEVGDNDDDDNNNNNNNNARQPLLPRKGSYKRCLSHAGDELKSFRSCLRWLCVDQSDTPRAVVSWSLFFLLGLFVPAASHFLLIYSPARRPYDLAVQLSLTAVSALSYLCLSAFHRRYGLRRFLFLDKLVGVSERVRLGYTIQLNSSFRLLAFFLMPSFAGDVAYKVWWHATGAGRLPDYLLLLFGGRCAAWVSEAVACGLELASWIYRMAIFFLVCVLFRLICYLQILRLQDFAAVFQEESDVATLLREHLRIRKQLRIISHRYRAFILSSLILVSASNFASLLLTTGHHHADTNIANAGELALCSIGLMTGLLICLRGAAKITHKAQAITSHAATWHVFATIESFDADTEDATSETSANAYLLSNSTAESDEEARDEDELDDTKLIPSHVNTISFQKRQALVTYLENNRAGITVFGFVVDRSWLHGLFMIEFSLILWLLGKTIGIS
ncbi:hypothetical protein COCNU_01G010080 [Cocos nucifera]|uniref:Uncharacterized protein n=1 Tax=Cocos nucifera TaxID=13894 RepID=A0A8K0HV58_COCNU|nr:hypothetical protein COCNU_01G010080 [Cocos nucifera]